MVHVNSTHESTQERVCAEGTSLTTIVGVENDTRVLDGDHHGERPYYDRQDTDEILVTWCRSERRGVDV